ncbi:MAG: c-type cytochrome [Chloroflexi bacterium]|nr:c-type cytochrome [Chloroflexota bacterium]
MKLRHVMLVLTIAILLAACNFTLAEDVTPPPNYVPPAPAPTMGPLFPPNTPDIENGAAIYAEKCEACHGTTGLGDGPQGLQLPVTVAAIGLPNIAQKALPSAWYIQVTQGNLDRFMPPFASLNDQERWDVVFYALTLHTKPEQIEAGKSLLESNCADCEKTFSNLEMMAELSENDLIQLMKEGNGDIPAFGKNFSDEEAASVAIYLRTLTFASSSAPVAVAATQTPVSTEAVTPSAQTTPVDGTQAAVTPEAGTEVAVTPADGTQVAVTPEAGTEVAVTPADGTQISGTPQAAAEVTATAEPTLAEGMGTVSGSIDNQTGKPLPSDIKVTLRAMEHGSDPNTGPAEIAALEATANADGTFIFKNVEVPENRIFVADVEVNGSVYQSGFTIVKAGETNLVIPPITIFEGSTDYTTLQIVSLQMYFDFAIEGSAQVFSIYTVANITDKTVTVKMTSAMDIPFIAFPEGAEPMGFQATQDTAAFIQTADGFAMPPSTSSYGLIAFASIPKTDEMTLSQTALLPIGEVKLFLPEGMEAQGDTLKDEGIQPQNNTNYHVYSSGGLDKDESVKFTVTGKPTSVAVNPNVLQNKTLLIGVGALGLVLVLAGVWLFLRGPKPVVEESDQEENDFDDAESLMDAIIALDDLHRAGKLSDEAYQKRRDELKSALKRRG